MKLTHVTTTEELNKCIDLRFEVFVDEQKVPIEEERDQYDRLDVNIDHFYVMDDTVCIGTIRCLSKAPDTMKVGRVAVKREFRKSGVGRFMMTAIEQWMIDQGIKNLILEAQDHAIPFYEKCGYIATGDFFMDAGIPHKSMSKKL